jgi:hypothetical protein
MKGRKSQAATESALLQMQKPWGKTASMKLTKTTKSQAAMEFLMTYGWALLVVIIVIAALAFFGLLNPSRFLPEKCEIAPGINVLDFSAKTNDSTSSILNLNYFNRTATQVDAIVLLLSNGMGTTMNNMYINISQCGNGTYGENLGGDGAGTTGGINSFTGTAFYFAPTSGMVNYSNLVPTFAEGATQQFVIPCAGMTPNGRFRSDVIVNYTTTIDGTTVTHVKKGYLVVQVQKI